MKTRYLWIALLVGSMSSLGGCIVVNGSDAYEDCVDSFDCRSGRHNCANILTDTGARGAMCTVVDCVDASNCDAGSTGLGAACLEVFGSGRNICYETCTGDLDCTQGGRGWTCQPTTAGVNICLPGISSPPPPPPLSGDYQGCTTTPDCAAGLSCATITTTSAADEMCTILDCLGDADCGGSANGETGACLNILGSGGNVCYERCMRDSDCTGNGWTCSDAMDDLGVVLARICLPF